jgi:hypothetical protein
VDVEVELKDVDFGAAARLTAIVAQQVFDVALQPPPNRTMT